jgi:ubiquinone/menaquinone biosynthesis C-methylase UbiE
VGTGPGYLPIEIAKRRPKVKIDSIDLSKRMVEIAKRNVREAGLCNQIHLEKGNANHLRFGDNLYDMVISTGVFHSWKQPIRALNEIHRVLKPGGLALIYDPALIFTNRKELLQHCLTWRDKLAFIWAMLAYFLTYPMRYSVESVQSVLSQTRFQDYEVDKKDYIRMRLRKLP